MLYTKLTRHSVASDHALGPFDQYHCTHAGLISSSKVRQAVYKLFCFN